MKIQKEKTRLVNIKRETVLITGPLTKHQKETLAQKLEFK